jgi:hypothetical protein
MRIMHSRVASMGCFSGLVGLVRCPGDMEDAKHGQTNAATALSAVTDPAVAPNAQGCYDPADFGAQPTPPGDSPLDARPGIQAAMDAAAAAGGGRVCLGAGRLYVSRPPVTSYDRFAALATHGKNLEIIGNQFTQATDQDIDGEPSGGGAQADWSVTVTGLTPPHTHVVVTGNNSRFRSS